MTLPVGPRSNLRDMPWVADLSRGLAFLTAIPLPLPVAERAVSGRLVDAAWTFPIIGAAIGLAGGLVLTLAWSVGLATIHGFLAVLTIIIVTGASPERGLAATADAAAGRTPPERLDFLRVHRLGSNGVVALLFSVLLRGLAISGFGLNPTDAVLILIASESISRAAMVRQWRALPPALLPGPTAGEAPDERNTVTAIAIGALVAGILTLIGGGIWPVLVGLAGTAAVVLTFEAACRRRLGGHTLEILGAGQQLASVGFLVLALAFY